MFKGRLGLDTARIPHVDRHGLIWLERGKLSVDAGNLVFATAGSRELDAGVYEIPFQTVSNVLMGPGTTVSHDALRILAKNQTGLFAVGSGGVRLYASLPPGPDRSELARRQVTLWSNSSTRVGVARHMYALRFGELLPQTDLNALRGIEGTRMKAAYRRNAEQFGVKWSGRRYGDWKGKGKGSESDDINAAIDHVSAAVRAAAEIATAVTGTVPHIGFIHEASRLAFSLDIADLFRTSFLIPVAFESVKRFQREGGEIERVARKLAGTRMREQKLVAEMIDAIKKLLEAEHAVDGSDNA
jgi:CRISPR-associated protein Cas1